ncbi:hypothetical protein POM88_044437 [Heracleum sosnowskyi]|uniref:Uncharacterized protein n=1 Tax=Heracleum sosnowskyi TaxID=360622 RepID=A0AAD8H4F3_9APIA|nr:hypothetical protein POM88_044437 [Heracleum sosnowskyi]
MFNSKWNSQDHEWEEVDARGQAGGLLSSWDSGSYKKVKSVKSENWIWCELHDHMDDDDKFHVINVYNPRKEKIKEWSKDPNNNVNTRIREVEEYIARLDNSVISNTQKQQLRVIRYELEDLYDHKVAMLRQQARITWQVHGDKNSKFYQQAVMSRRNKNLINKIFWEGNWISSPSQLKEAFFKHFSDFFGKEKSWVLLKLNDLEVPKLLEVEARGLDRDTNLLEL